MPSIKPIIYTCILMGLWEDHNTYVCGAIGWERAARTCNCNVTVWYVVKWSGIMCQQCSPVRWLIYSYTPWSVVASLWDMSVGAMYCCFVVGYLTVYVHVQ